MPTLPAVDLDKGVCRSPHVVILGAGCSIAACPNGDKNGKKLPSMDKFFSVLGLNQMLAAFESITGKNLLSTEYQIVMSKNLS